MNRQKYFSKHVAAVMDIDYDLECGPHTPELIAKKMRKLAQIGFQRVQLIVPPPGYPNYNASSMFLNNDPAAHFHLQSVLNVGDPVLHYINEAHNAGMEAIAVMKPYEGGGSYTLPHGRKPLIPRHCLEQLGGCAFGFDNFIARHPEMRVERRQMPELEKAIDRDIHRIELAFCLEQIEQQCTDNKYHVFNAADNDKPLENIRLWISNDNGKYEPYDGPVVVAESQENRIIPDVNGQPLYTEPKKCRIVNISSLKLKDKYIAVSFDNPAGEHVTLPYSMISLFASDSSAIPATVTSRVRTKMVVTDDFKTFGGNGDFRDSGFEFQALDTIYFGNGWENGVVYGIAKGKLLYMKGTHCEAYPEVRAYWLKQIEHLLQLGADGVDIRLLCHSTGVVDFMNYGFNPPVIAAFRSQYGREPDNTTDDYLKIMRIRGKFFELFLSDAASMLKSQDKILQVHLQGCYAQPSLKYNFNDPCFWAMPKLLLDWQAVIDLADEITLKDYNWGHYDPNHANAIKDYAQAQGKPLWIICYLQQGWDLNQDFCRAINDDERVYGLQLYEMVCNSMPAAASQESKGLIGITPEGQLFVNPATLKALQHVGLNK